MGDEDYSGYTDYDTQFDDGLFQARLHQTRVARPAQWPKSVSEMRVHTVFGEQGVSGHDTAHRWQKLHADHYAAPARPAGGRAAPARPYHTKGDFWQPREHDRAGPATAVWHPFTGSGHAYIPTKAQVVWNPYVGYMYYDQSARMWRDISGKR